MTPATATSTVWTNWTWPDEVRAFAAEQQAEAYLEPLREALARLFPTATEVRVFIDRRDLPCIAIDVTVPCDDLPDYVAAKGAWFDEVLHIMPTTKMTIFSLILYPR